MTNRWYTAHWKTAALLAALALAACSDPGLEQPALCGECPPCEVCTAVDDGYMCAPVSHSFQQCGEDDNVHWLDSCGTDEGVAQVCADNRECADSSDEDAECVCRNHWEGDSCDLCPGNWDPAADCDACVGNWDPAADCEECLGNWDLLAGCAVCEGNWDEASGCEECANHWTDESDDCGTCPANWDPDQDCAACANHWEGTDCDTCPGNWDPAADCAACEGNWLGSDCDICPGNWDPAADCTACEGNWDVAFDCEACVGNWSIESSCTVCANHWTDQGDDCGTCPGNWDETDDCASCSNAWLGTDCDICPGNWDETADCAVCENNWVDEDNYCGTCPGNWDPDQDCAACRNNWEGADCATCPGNWDPDHDCGACEGNWDPATGCTVCANEWTDEGDDCGTCPAGWDPLQDCAQCAGNFDPLTDCTECVNNWSGADCDTCPAGYDPSSDCASCLGNFDPSTDCTTCYASWTGTDCLECPDNWDPYQDCAACQTNWTGADCDTCPANWDETLNCAVCSNEWTGADCDVCPAGWDSAANCADCLGNWDLATGCTECAGGWIDEGNDCGTCGGNWDATADCADCLPGWDIATDCLACVGNLDESTDCADCLPGWSGTDCEVQDTCVRYVDASSSAVSPDGHSWSRAFADLQEGIDSAFDATLESGGPETCEVWVAAGTYYVWSNSDNDSIRMMPGVDMYGGFAGSETDRAERNIEANESIVDGLDSPEGTNRVDYIVLGSDDARFDGFTVTHGGSFLCELESPTIANCVFRYNNGHYEDGPLTLRGSEAVVTGTRFEGNTADMSGIFEIREGAPTVDGCVFEDNGTFVTSAVSLISTSGVLKNSVFTGNYFTDDLEAVATVYVHRGTPLIENCVFHDNWSASTSAAIYAGNSEGRVNNCTIYENTASMTDGAGGIYEHSTYAVLAITNCILWNNSPAELGVSGTTTLPQDISHSIVEGGASGTAILEQDPLFAAPEDGDFSLQSGSPAIDSADGFTAAETDLLGMSRWDDPAVVDAVSCGGNPDCVSHPDMGALEGVDGMCAGNWDPYTLCAQCRTHWIDAGDDCWTCPANWDAAADCDACLPGWDEASDCATCANSWTGAACDVCPGNWDPTADCAACIDGFDPDDDCLTCLPGWSGSACDVQDECVRYVGLDSTSAAPNGLSWTQAFPTLQPAIDSANAAYVASGETTTCQVWVKAGTYYIWQEESEDTVQLRPGVEVYGGFAGGESALGDRNHVDNETILSGLNAPEGPIRHYCHHVVTGSDDAVLDGFEITRGQAPGETPTALGMGGGLLNWAASPTVRNCFFRSNSAGYCGGGIANYVSSPIIENCLFLHNTSGSGFGGRAIYNNLGDVLVVNCTSYGYCSSSEPGCIIYSEDSEVTVQNSILWTTASGSQTVLHSGTGFTSVDHSTIRGGYAGAGNLSSDPQFFDPDYPAYDFSLQATSPCIDAADGSTATALDYMGEPRVDYAGADNTGIGPPWADMGIYEYQP